MRTAGHAVLASGVTVAISLIALVVIPVPLLRSMGFGGMLIPLCSVAVVLTLLPAHARRRRSTGGHPAHPQGGHRVARVDRLGPDDRQAPVAVRRCRPARPRDPASPRSATSSSGSPAPPPKGTASPAYQTLQTLIDGGVGTGVVSPIVLLADNKNDAVAIAAAAGEGRRDPRCPRRTRPAPTGGPPSTSSPTTRP